MAVAQSNTDRPDSLGYQLCQGFRFGYRGTGLCQRTGYLVYEDRSRKAPSSDNCTLFARDCAVISNDDKLHGMPRMRYGVLFFCKTKEKDVSGAEPRGSSDRLDISLKGLGHGYSLSHDDS